MGRRIFGVSHVAEVCVSSGAIQAGKSRDYFLWGWGACFKIHSKNDSRAMEWWALCVRGHSLTPRPNRINNEPWWTSHLTFSAVAEICGLAKRLFPREGLIPITPEQCFIFLYHTDFFRG